MTAVRHYDLMRTIWNAFEVTAGSFPHACAVWWERSYDYAEVGELAEGLSKEVQAAVPAGSLLALDTEDYLSALVAMLAAARAGCPVLPLNPHAPSLYRAAVMDDARPAAVLHESSPGKFSLIPQPLRTGAPTQLDGAAYVLYTSGSTGRPKGVIVSQRALLDRLTGLASTPGLARGESIMAMTALTFDISMAEVLLPLVTAGTVIAAPRARRDPAHFAAMVSEHEPAVIQATPSFWRMALEMGWAGAPRSRLWCGGETLTQHLANRLLPLCQELWNLYGPTEATIYASGWRVEAGAPITLGPPLPGTGLLLVDQAGIPVTETGEAGEIVLYGSGIANGYLHQPELTGLRFGSIEIDGVVHPAYRTGDRAALLASGTVAFLGRADHQVKLRGHRIELGELESVLEEHPAVSETVAIVQFPEDPDRAYIAVFAVIRDHITTKDLRAWLAARLPAGSLPRTIELMEKLPRTEAGKIDRVGLARKDAAASGSCRAPAP